MADDLRDRLPGLMVRDQLRLGRRLDRARRLRGEKRAQELAAVARAVEAGEAKVERRRAGLPQLRYPEGLPILDRKDDLLAAIRDHQVVIVAGETGSGKSTQLPKLCLELGRGVRGTIAHTQPRRLAARTIAERIAEELQVELGGPVGYAVRFTDQASDRTLLKLVTDGILLAEVQRDRLLSAYDTIIVDEAHERSLNIDFLLGYLKQLLPQRPDLKVVVTSATIDTERFSRHFGGAPIVEVSGRSYPVEVRYRPFAEEPDDDRDQVEAIGDAVEELLIDQDGDVLVFLSGEREIRDTAESLAKRDLGPTELVPLYARLSSAEQHRVFEPHRGRRVVLATNVAETSLTVPGIRCVVDPGTARISRYSRRTKVQRLPIERISQASANQRAGRCGRVAPGTCIRLYSQEDFEARPEFTEPEVLRTNLASVILRLADLGLGDVERFPFVDPPDRRAIRDGVALLDELGALDRSHEGSDVRLTPLGKRLAKLPVDPRIARMVLEAERQGVVREVLVIAAFLSIQDPRERPTDKAAHAQQLHARFSDPDSDFIAVLNLWGYVRDQRRELSSGQFRKLCKAEFLHWLRIREWQDVHGQLLDVARSLGVERTEVAGDLDRGAVHLSLLAGLLSHIGMYDPQRMEYQGARGARFTIGSGSPLAKKKARWVVAAELVETNRLWARTVARIDPDRIEKVAEHLVSRSHGEPTWDERQGASVVPERVTLYGLPIASRRVQHARLDPEGARDMFVRHALVDGEWATSHDFVRRNEETLRRLERLGDRARRPVAVTDAALLRFFDARVPDHVLTARHFDRWWRDERAKRPDLLCFTAEDVLDPELGRTSPDDFPDTWRQGDLDLPLRYLFRHGDVLDGVTVDVPLEVLDRLPADGFDWQVPGRREELVGELIRTLPKPLRRRFVPIPDVVRDVLAECGPEDGPLVDVVARQLQRIGGEPLPPGSLDPDLLPDHLRITFRAVARDGRPVATSKDLPTLQGRLRSRSRAAVAEASPTVERTGLTTWSIGALPTVVEAKHQGHGILGHPALVDRGDHVDVRILLTAAEQAAAMRTGTRRLLLLALGQPERQLEKGLSNEAALDLAGADDPAGLLADCAAAAVDHLMAEAGGPAWDADGFARLERHVRAGFQEEGVRALASALQVVDAAGDVRDWLEALSSEQLQPAIDDVADQLDRLVGPGFVTAAGTRRLPDLLRYVRAMEVRLDRVGEAVAKDRQLQRQVNLLEERYRRAARHDPDGRVRWLLEELRVGLFAQQLGTKEPVSEQRVRRELDRLVAAR